MIHMDMDDSAVRRKASVRFAESVRMARAQRRWSQQDVAEKAGTTADRVSQIESGLIDPRLSTVERIADALGITVTIGEAA